MSGSVHRPDHIAAPRRAAASDHAVNCGARYARCASAIAAAILATSLCSCDSAATSSKHASRDEAGHAHDRDAHEHVHVAPHGGTLVPVGEHFANVELVLDPADGRLTAFVLDGCAENAIRLAQGTIVIRATRASDTSVGGSSAQLLELRAVANSLTGERAGDTSQFEDAHDALRGARGLRGTILKIAIKGQEFEGIAFAIEHETSGRSAREK